jgi:hypothetical protein
MPEKRSRTFKLPLQKYGPGNDTRPDCYEVNSLTTHMTDCSRLVIANEL